MYMVIHVHAIINNSVQYISMIKDCSWSQVDDQQRNGYLGGCDCSVKMIQIVHGSVLVSIYVAFFAIG